MSGHLAGITVDAVREQLAALGHDDVSDDVIASFLTSLDHQVGNGHNFASTSSSGSMMNSDGGAGGVPTQLCTTQLYMREDTAMRRLPRATNGTMHHCDGTHPSTSPRERRAVPRSSHRQRRVLVQTMKIPVR